MNPPTYPTTGVFDSGFGGLTVLRALLPLLHDANPRRPSNQPTTENGHLRLTTDNSATEN
jgi:hypothetical protein